MQHNARNIVTLFHKPNFAPSMRVLALLKQTSAEASETATVDQASDHSHQNKVQRADFDLDISEQAPTEDQLRNILEYAGGEKAQEVVEGETSVSDALRKLKEDGKKFKYPVVSTQDARYLQQLKHSRPWIGTMVKQVSSMHRSNRMAWMANPAKSLVTTNLRYSSCWETCRRRTR